MRHIVVGTAGHVDHGKTALIKALTGIDTDRLPEEKRRGISIELGFAHLELPGGVQLAFVDVPGHERFVKNMLAGAAGIDLVLLVVAADESIRPQTREHFEICRLLGIRQGLVAITKCDLVEEDIQQLVQWEVEEFLRGSFLEGAPIVRVSAATGQGLDELVKQLARLAAEVPVKDASRYFRLPIDRAFTLRGFGTVVTGTIWSGRIKLEDWVELQPGGQRARVRRIQAHGRDVEEAVAGQRCALNLSGEAASVARRGLTLVPPALFQATGIADCQFELLAGARPLKHGSPVHFHAATAEVIAQARLLENPTVLEPGRKALVRFVFREPVLLLPGDRFVVRMFSPVVTIGGGEVIEIAPPERLRRAQAVERLRELASASWPERLRRWTTEAPLGCSLRSLAGRSGLPEASIEMYARQDPDLELLAGAEPWLISRDAAARLRDRLRETLRNFHQQNPLQPGMSREELRSRTLPEAPPHVFEWLMATTEGVEFDGDLVRLSGHQIQLSPAQREALERLETLYAQAGLTPPSLQEALEAVGLAAQPARELVQLLLRHGRLVRLAEGLYLHESAIERVRTLLQSKRGQKFRVPEFKQWTGVSRKYAIPLLEYLDRLRVTRREGDWRTVL